MLHTGLIIIFVIITIHIYIYIYIYIYYSYYLYGTKPVSFLIILPTCIFLWSEKERGLTCEPMEIRTLTGGKSGQRLFVRSVSKAIKVRKNSSQRLFLKSA